MTYTLAQWWCCYWKVSSLILELAGLNLGGQVKNNHLPPSHQYCCDALEEVPQRLQPVAATTGVVVLGSFPV